MNIPYRQYKPVSANFTPLFVTAVSRSGNLHQQYEMLKNVLFSFALTQSN